MGSEAGCREKDGGRGEVVMKIAQSFSSGCGEYDLSPEGTEEILSSLRDFRIEGVINPALKRWAIFET